jgi:hypothetical protein
VGEAVVAAGLAGAAALVVGAAALEPAVPAAEGALPGARAGQVEPEPLVERAAVLGPAPLEVVRARQVAGRAPVAVGRQPELAAARGHLVAAPQPAPEPALLRGRPVLRAGPGLPGSDPGHPAVAEVRGEVRKVLEPPPSPEAQAVRVARTLSPCWTS